MNDDIPKSPEKVSAFVICQNEGRRIRRCLESLKWCDEIVVIDGGSTDSTLEICREYTDRIFVRPWPGFVEQKGFGLAQCSHEWVLNLDADEELSPGLIDEIKRQVLVPSAQNAGIDGYYLSRIVYYLNRWWRKGGWYPEHRLRLCRRSKTTWGGENPHEKAIVSGQTRKLSGELFHYTYDNIADHVQRLNRYSTTAAESMKRRGARSSRFKLVLNPFSRTLKFYLFKQGFKEGFPGLLVAILEGYYVFLKYMKLWEIEIAERGKANG